MDRPLRLQEDEPTGVTRQSAHEGGSVASPTHWPLLPQEIFQVLISARDLVNPRSIVRSEVLGQ
jgi:hypothetical protein